MSLTTDITGGLFGPSEEDLQKQEKIDLGREKLDLLREYLANQSASKAYEEAQKARKEKVARYYQRMYGGSSPSLDKTKVYPSEIGEPTSYGGQQPLSGEEAEKARQRGMVLGAEGQPIEVIRGGQASYVGPRGGKEEYATPGQARQAFRRDLGIGEYVPPGGTLADLKQKPEKTDNLLHPIKYFETLFLRDHGIEDPQTKERKLPDYAQGLMLRALPKIKTPEDALRIYDELKPQLEEGKRLSTLGSRENRERIIQNFMTAQKMGLIPEGQANLDPKAYFNAPVTPENSKNFEYWLNWQPPKRENKQVPGASVVQSEGGVSGW